MSKSFNIFKNNNKKKIIFLGNNYEQKPLKTTKLQSNEVDKIL
jgi:hypothetical protein